MNYKTDINVLKDIVKKYIFSDPELQKVVIPALAVLIMGKFIQVKAAAQVKDLSELIKDKHLSFGFLCKFGFYMLVSISISEFSSAWLCKFGQRGYRNAAKDGYEYYLRLHPTDYSSIGKGTIQNNIKRRASAVKDTIDVLTLNFTPLIFTLIFSFWNIFHNMNLKSLLLICFAIFLYIYLTIKTTIWRNKIREDLIESTNKNQNILIDGLNNFEVIYTSATEKYEINRYNKYLKVTEKENTYLTRTMYFLNFVQGIIWESAIFILIFFNYFVMSKNDKNISEIGYILTMTGMLKSSLFNIGFMYGKYKSGIMNFRLTNKPSRSIKTLGKTKFGEFKKAISVYDLTMCYGDKIILESVNFNILKGEKIALIGSNGCGKSTLLKSLLKLNGANGYIFIDDHDVERIIDEDFRKLFTYIPQNPTLFDEDVKYNIKYNHQKVFDDAMYSLASKMGLHDDIVRLNAGYETLCGENGTLLSGGERQKIFFLRALLSEIPVLALDEATSALDKKSEDNIFSRISKMKDLTVIAIVHNLELLKYFDRILKVENRKVHEIPFNELKLN
ncbi:ATM1 [Hepatospora eriocheir]|uniref:ATM1 n=1 Tax=Hepatospora eriocheir TaxID=1081669 RepID=A0A1X0QKD3_9MICR|nr:ATM1 [Hepatospora eriocheir]